MTTAHEHPNQFALLSQRRFAPFFWVQFLGAGNDNLFKFAFTELVNHLVFAEPTNTAARELQASALLLARPARSGHRPRHHRHLHHPPHLASQRGRAGSSALRRSVGAWLLLPTR